MNGPPRDAPPPSLLDAKIDSLAESPGVRTDDAPTRDLDSQAGQFFSLTPDKVLDAVEDSGHHTTGLCYPLNSLENRVYEVELDGGERWVGKFYRPGRWSQQTIEDEHRLLLALQAEEIPVCAPIVFDDGKSLHQTQDGIHFALFPRTGGRAPEEIDQDGYAQLGRLLGRIHNVAAKLGLTHRPVISPATYGTAALRAILEHGGMPGGLGERYRLAAEELVTVATEKFSGVELTITHGDCHKGNLLRGRDGWFFLDFDDMAMAPAVQDLWLLIPGRRDDCKPELDALLRGYEQFREFDHRSLHLIEVLRGLRYVRYAAWVALRWHDPAFQRAFPGWGTEGYWQTQVVDLYEQLRVIESEGQQPIHDPGTWHD